MKKQAPAPQQADGNYGPASQAAPVSWRTKAGYIGTGIVIGVVIYPFVRKTITRLQPGLDKLFDGLTGKAEGLAEMASDLIAKAKQNLQEEASAKPKAESVDSQATNDKHGHGHDHDHDH